VRENAMNVRVKGDQRLGISDRFSGYFRMENGALWCHNQEELGNQAGIIAEVLSRTPKT
jgi:hypothetical protein